MSKRDLLTFSNLLDQYPYLRKDRYHFPQTTQEKLAKLSGKPVIFISTHWEQIKQL